ncbi:hypothetical protein NXS19_001447 [Fusarium pseudograminearum]|nr:hypothetical protein NXS19_001447 [Fusarium pseudograminearum]
MHRVLSGRDVRLANKFAGLNRRCSWLNTVLDTASIVLNRRINQADQPTNKSNFTKHLYARRPCCLFCLYHDTECDHVDAVVVHCRRRH